MMRLEYNGKQKESDILNQTPELHLRTIFGDGLSNLLIHADNKGALKTLLNEYRGKVNLIYIDPPFATNTHFRMGSDRVSTISSSTVDEIAYSDTLIDGPFLEFLRERLILLRELLSENGSIYLHIDYKIGHYVKLIMDEVFGRASFRNDITRIKCNPKNFSRRAYGNIKDLILFYSKSQYPTWNDPRIALSKRDRLDRFKKVDSLGRLYTTIPLHAPGETKNGNTSKAWRGIKPPRGRHWRTDPAILEQWDLEGLIEWSSNGVPRKKIFADENRGKKVQDIWEFKDPQYPKYPTEKNIELLKFIIEASSRAGDIVLDCFAGSGTTMVAAQELGRSWIGIDQSLSAINIIRDRLDNHIRSGVSSPTYKFMVDNSNPLYAPKRQIKSAMRTISNH